jgi:lysophospholipase L1-like esterase
MRLLAIFFALAWGASPVEAATLAGVVRDASCAPLPGVQVTLQGDSTERQAITGSDGSFEFADLPEPRYSLRARLAGFRTFLTGDLKPSDLSRTLNVTLPLQELAVVDHVDQGRGPAAPLERSPLSVRVQDDACRPVGGAQVAIRGPGVSWTGATAADGALKVPQLPDGAYSVTVTADGFSRAVLASARIPFKTSVDVTLPLRRGPPDAVDMFDAAPPRRGERERMIVEAQPGSRVRIVAMGDSTTAGTPAFKSPREAPPNGSGDETSQYAYWLMKAHPDWEVINQGINAQRSDVIAARFEEDVIAKKPAVVVIIAGVNDVYQGRSAQHVKDQLAAMYKRAHDAGIRVVAGTIIPYNTATADQNARMHEINAFIQSEGRADPGAVFVDTRAAVAAADNPDKLASSPDGLHPDAAGYRKMADAIAPAIARALR